MRGIQQQWLVWYTHGPVQTRVRDLNELIEKKNVALEQVSALQAE